MTTDETQANLDIVIGTMFIFGTPVKVLFDSRSSRSFVNTVFALHTDRKLVPIKNKLMVTTTLGEQIFRTSVFKGFEILVE